MSDWQDDDGLTVDTTRAERIALITVGLVIGAAVVTIVFRQVAVYLGVWQTAVLAVAGFCWVKGRQR